MARATIRRVRPDEAAELTRLGARLFEATYRHLVDPADMAAHLASVFAADLQRAELIDPDVSTFLVHADDTPCGYLQVRRAPTPDAVDHAASIELRWFYVDPAFHGQGVAAEMMAAARVAARELGGAEMWLSVWRENPRAIAFYHKCGFMQVGTSEFEVGEDRRMDLIMVTSVREQIV